MEVFEICKHFPRQRQLADVLPFWPKVFKVGNRNEKTCVMARANHERQQKLEPKRINAAVAKLTALGLEITQRDTTTVTFIFDGHNVTFYPYSGWHTGKSIKDGRGADNLFKQLQK